MAIVRQDEILEKVISSDPSAVPRYNLRAPDGTFIGENIALELANAVTQMGTPVNAAALNEMLAASGITSGSSTAYTLAQEGFSLFDGATVRFRLHVVSGVKPTLNVNGTGAKPLVDAFGDAMQPEAAAGSWITATYSADIDSYTVGVMKYQEIVFPRRPDIIANIFPNGATVVEIPISKEYKNITVDVYDIHSSGESAYWNMELNVPSGTDYSNYTQTRLYGDAIALDYSVNDGTISYGSLPIMSVSNVAIPGLQAQVKMCFLGYRSAIIDAVARYLNYTNGRPAERVSQTRLSDYANDGNKTLSMRFYGNKPTGDISITVKGEK